MRADIDVAHVRQCYRSVSWPDFLFVIDVDAEITFARRPHHPPKDYGAYDGHDCSRDSYVAFQSAIAERLRAEVARVSEYTLVDGSRSSEEVAKDVISVIFDAGMEDGYSVGRPLS